MEWARVIPWLLSGLLAALWWHVMHGIEERSKEQESLRAALEPLRNLRLELEAWNDAALRASQAVCDFGISAEEFVKNCRTARGHLEGS